MQEEKELQIHTVIFMISVAIFFDILQILLSFIYLGWAVGILAGLTFYVWLKMHGMNFMRPKRFMAFGGSALIEMIPIPFLAVLPGWTISISYLTLSKKIQAIVPGADIVTLGLSSAQAASFNRKVLQFKPRGQNPSTGEYQNAV